MEVHSRSYARLAGSAALTIALILGSGGTAGAVAPRRRAASPIYGGTIRIAYASDRATLDPAQAVAED